MGANARCVGFGGDLTDLLDPLTNIEYGIKFFKLRCGQYIYPNDQAAAWNMGSVKRAADGHYLNQAYVDKFTEAYNLALSEQHLKSPTSA
jgi:soluble lytic murein transglycosylase-like protein